MSLKQTQSHFVHDILHNTVSGDYLSNGQFESDSLMQIYRNNFIENFTGALQASYKVIYDLVGEIFFRQLAKTYILEHPSDAGNLENYGHLFAEFINNQASCDGLPYLPDVARLAWVYEKAYQAQDSCLYDLAQLADFDPEQNLRVILQDGCYLLESKYPLLAIWWLNKNPEQSIDLNKGSCYLLVCLTRR